MPPVLPWLRTLYEKSVDCADAVNQEKVNGYGKSTEGKSRLERRLQPRLAAPQQQSRNQGAGDKITSGTSSASGTLDTPSFSPIALE